VPGLVIYVEIRQTQAFTYNRNRGLPYSRCKHNATRSAWGYYRGEIIVIAGMAVLAASFRLFIALVFKFLSTYRIMGRPYTEQHKCGSSVEERLACTLHQLEALFSCGGSFASLNTLGISRMADGA
jgi:hypothetical protein